MVTKIMMMADIPTSMVKKSLKLHKQNTNNRWANDYIYGVFDAMVCNPSRICNTYDSTGYCNSNMYYSSCDWTVGIYDS